MGCYLNYGPCQAVPINDLLKRGATLIGHGEYTDPATGFVSVCEIDNRAWKATGVAYDAPEAREFADSGRSTLWVKAPLELVREYAPDVGRYLARASAGRDGK